MKPEEFYSLCEDRLSFLKHKYGFQTVSTKADDRSYVVFMENRTTGVEINFEFENLYPRLYVYRVPVSTETTRECLDLRTLLEGRSPNLVYPTQVTEDFLDQMVKNVIAGKRNEAKQYPENLDPDEILSRYATALQQAAEDILRGDHQAFDELTTFSQPMAMT